jgi:hypothetical protein
MPIERLSVRGSLCFLYFQTYYLQILDSYRRLYKNCKNMFRFFESSSESSGIEFSLQPFQIKVFLIDLCH